LATAPPAGSAVPAPLGFVRVFIDSLVPTDSGAAVLLSPEPEAEDARILAIFIGGTEALSIQLRLRAERYPRPLTHDLLDSSLTAFDAKVREARITKLVGTTFIGALVITRKDDVVELDARPSDAIALALGSEAPIFVAREVLDRSAISRKELEGWTKARRPGDPTLL
jgi:bifunctional DNase/RNase